MLGRMSTTFEIPTLHTDRLTLRAFRATDLDALADMQANSKVRRFLGGNLLTRAETWSLMERILGQWALRGYGMFAVEVEGHCAGWTGVLHPLEWLEPELAYSLDQPFWGRGIATEAVRAARAWAFTRLDVNRLASFIMPENTRSARVVQKLGAVRDGTTTIRGFTVDWWVHRK
jgi:RimJ/RimL family protein N-acetyltransferase